MSSVRVVSDAGRPAEPSWSRSAARMPYWLACVPDKPEDRVLGEAVAATKISSWCPRAAYSATRRSITSTPKRLLTRRSERAGRRPARAGGPAVRCVSTAGFNLNPSPLYKLVMFHASKDLWVLELTLVSSRPLDRLVVYLRSTDFRFDQPDGYPDGILQTVNDMTAEWQAWYAQAIPSGYASSDTVRRILQPSPFTPDGTTTRGSPSRGLR